MKLSRKHEIKTAVTELRAKILRNVVIISAMTTPPSTNQVLGVDDLRLLFHPKEGVQTFRAETFIKKIQSLPNREIVKRNEG